MFNDSCNRSGVLDKRAWTTVPTSNLPFKQCSGDRQEWGGSCPSRPSLPMTSGRRPVRPLRCFQLPPRIGFNRSSFTRFSAWQRLQGQAPGFCCELHPLRIYLPIHFRAAPHLQRRCVQGSPDQGCRSACRPRQQASPQGCPAGGVQDLASNAAPRPAG